MYKTIFLLAYYGLLRIGEVAESQHCLLAPNVNIGENKDKIQLILLSSKTHASESKPQEIKISAIDSLAVNNMVRCKNRFSFKAEKSF